MTTFIILLIAVLYSINDYDKLIQRKEKQSKKKRGGSSMSEHLIECKRSPKTATLDKKVTGSNHCPSRKTIIAILFTCFLNININAQSTDTVGVSNRFKSIEKKILELETNTELAQFNLYKCHKQWNDGLGVCIFGLGATTLGTIMITEGEINNEVSITTTCVGGLATLIGSIIMIDSHKYIGKAGLKLNQNGIVYVFK